MFTRHWVKIISLAGILVSVWFSSSPAREGKALSSEALMNIGPALAKAYTAEPIHPAMPDHLWLDEGNDRIRLLMFSKPVSDPTAILLFVGEGIKGRFCAESQPYGGKTGYSHFHRIHTPAGDMSMSGPKGEEGYWLKHVAVGEFEMEKMHFKPGFVMDLPQPPTPKCK